MSRHDPASPTGEKTPEPGQTPPSMPVGMLVASWIGRLVVGGVFLYAGVHKLLAPDTFAQDIANYQAFPHWTWNLAAAIVPVTEVLGALAVITGFKRRAAVIVLGALNVAFIALIVSVIWRGIDLGCGCFGTAAEADAVGWPMLLRDLALMLALAAAYLGERKPTRVPD